MSLLEVMGCKFVLQMKRAVRNNYFGQLLEISLITIVVSVQ